jgi:uncharacterized protein YkwD
MVLRRLVVAVVVAGAAVLATTARASSSMESEVFSLINGERSTPLVEHSGLLDVARMNSMRMARDGGLEHDDDSEIMSAAPDPPQGSGPPDAGFATAAWCENVTYSTGFPESEVANKLYEQWRNSPPHQACMTNESKNVGAVGIYYDGSTWWATFIAEVDSTPPGGAAAPHAAAPAASAIPRPPSAPAVDAPVGSPHAPPAAPAGALPATPTPAAGSSAPPRLASPPGVAAKSANGRYTIAVTELAASPASARRGGHGVSTWAEIAVLETAFLVAMRRLRRAR